MQLFINQLFSALLNHLFNQSKQRSLELGGLVFETIKLLNVLIYLVKVTLHLKFLCEHRVALDFEYFECLLVDFLADDFIVPFYNLVVLCLFLTE